MQLFDKFWKVTKDVVGPLGISAHNAQLLATLEPSKIYVENVRSILDVSHENAVRILETAVRQGLFTRNVEVLCPDGTVAASADTEEHLPLTVHCWMEEEGHPEEVFLQTASLRKTVFYKLNERAVSESYPRTA